MIIFILYKRAYADRIGLVKYSNITRRHTIMNEAQSIPTFTQTDCKQISEKSHYQNFLNVIERQYEIAQFDSQKKLKLSREYLNAKKVVGVLLVDLKNQQIVLTEQFRIGAVDDAHSPWLLEVVAGMHDKDESNAKLAEREVKEEAGCEFSSLIPMYEYWVSPGISNEHVSLYCGLINAPQAGVFGNTTEQENIKTHVVDFATAFKWAKNGKIKNAMTLIAIQWLQLNQDDLTTTSVDNYY